MTPLSAPEFADLMARFAPFEARPALAVAVSGGRDSVALVVLAHQWAGERQGGVLALIVDHGLRPESAVEAQSTRARLAALGIEVETLAWSGAKPTTRIQQAAREARYRLLFEACRRHGLLHLLTAHHANDQAETLAMRAARASGPDGLAGMAALVEHRDGRLLRPLLAVPRARLTATLEARGIGWIDDPSNEDRRFERVRVRQDGRTTLAPTDGRAARDREVAEAALRTLEVAAEGVALDQLVVSDLGKEITGRLLGRVVQAVGGGAYAPKRERLERAAARLSLAQGHGQERGKSGKSRDFTLSGCQLMLRRDPATRRLRWIVRPESGRRNAKTPGHPLVPAAFFACGASAETHLGLKPFQTDRPCEPVQS
ncbi:MAG: tRNA lysidine(34) synthetase TilS [Reyranellales bacterium]